MMKTRTKEFLENLTPEQAYEVLVEGNERFINNIKVNRNLIQQVNDTADGQYPFAVVLSCMDSRTSVELIFDQGLGDIFSVRVAGNIVNDDVIGSIEYACNIFDAKLIVVLGHSRCGVIKGACENVHMGHITGLLQKIKPALERAKTYEYDNIIYSEKVAHCNVLCGIDQILEQSTIVRSLFEGGRVGIVGGMYGIENGKVNFIKKMLPGKVAVRSFSTV